MDNREVVNWLIRIRDRLMTTSSKQFDALTIAIEKQEQDRWIPVSKDLPKKNGDYLVTCEVCGERYVEESFFCRCDDGDMFWTSQNVIAWKPRIEPYTAEEES